MRARGNRGRGALFRLPGAVDGDPYGRYARVDGVLGALVFEYVGEGWAELRTASAAAGPVRVEGGCGAAGGVDEDEGVAREGRVDPRDAEGGDEECEDGQGVGDAWGSVS